MVIGFPASAVGWAKPRPQQPHNPSPPGPHRQARVRAAWIVLAGPPLIQPTNRPQLGYPRHIGGRPRTTFFPPLPRHLFLYSGQPAPGPASPSPRHGPAPPHLGNKRARAVDWSPPGRRPGPPFRVLGGTFTAPLGLPRLPASGARLPFLLYGPPSDLWWHSDFLRIRRGYSTPPSTRRPVPSPFLRSTMVGKASSCFANRFVTKRWGGPRPGILVRARPDPSSRSPPFPFKRRWSKCPATDRPPPCFGVLLFCAARWLLINRRLVLGRGGAIGMGPSSSAAMQAVLWGWFSSWGKPWALRGAAVGLATTRQRRTKQPAPRCPNLIPMFPGSSPALPAVRRRRVGSSHPPAEIQLRNDWMLPLGGLRPGLIVRRGPSPLQTRLHQRAAPVPGPGSFTLVGSAALNHGACRPVFLATRFGTMLRTAGQPPAEVAWMRPNPAPRRPRRSGFALFRRRTGTRVRPVNIVHNQTGARPAPTRSTVRLLPPGRSGPCDHSNFTFHARGRHPRTSPAR